MSGYGGCTSCEGRCCREYVVPVNGQDVWSLSRATGVPPASFVVLLGAEELSDSPGKAEVAAGVRLVTDGPMVTMVLDKRFDSGGSAPCVFLVELDSGRARCGVYEARPAVCRAFPFAFHHGSVAVRRDVICLPGSWNVAAVDLSAQRTEMLRYELEWAVHRVVAAAWNEQVDQGRLYGRPRLYDAGELWDFWLAAYDRVASVVGSYPSADFRRLTLGWGRDDPAGAPPWRTFLHRIAEELSGLGAGTTPIVTGSG